MDEPLDLVLQARVHDVGRAGNRASLEVRPGAAAHRRPEVVNELHAGDGAIDRRRISEVAIHDLHTR